MKQIKVNPSNEKYYSSEFIKGFNCGAQRQFEADMADRKTEPQTIRCPKCGRSDYIREFGKDFSVTAEEAGFKYKCINCNTYIEPQSNRKTENNSEKPNNCKDAENPSGDVWECGCFLDTYCEHQIYDRNPDGTINIVECGYEPKDEPQTEREG